MVNSETELTSLLRRARARLGAVPALGSTGDIARIGSETRGTHRRRLELDVLLPGLQRSNPAPSPLDRRRCPTAEDASRGGQAGTPRPEVVRDEHGNALGGIRLPDLEVPTASHSGLGTQRPRSRFGFLYGTATDFDGEQLAALYPDSASYLKAWNEALTRFHRQA